MLGARGNPSTADFFAILQVLQKRAGVKLTVKVAQRIGAPRTGAVIEWGTYDFDETRIGHGLRGLLLFYGPDREEFPRLPPKKSTSRNVHRRCQLMAANRLNAASRPLAVPRT
jgi:hypothetical protein